MDLTVLKEKNPAAAEFVELWRAKYERSYDLSDVKEQADFYEGVLCLTRFIAKQSNTGSLRCSPSSTGIAGLSVDVTPKT
jgi:hypothetical protein